MKTIGVMGPRDTMATPHDLGNAYEIGRYIASKGAALLCGGMTGVMEASAKGAKEAGGLTIGISPTHSKDDLNEYIEVPLATGMGAGRNYMNVISSDVLVFVNVGSPGTLSELVFAIQIKKPSIVIAGSDNLEAFVRELESEHIIFVQSVDEVFQKLDEMMSL